MATSDKPDLFIGASSQLAHFWPKENVQFVSSHNLLGYRRDCYSQRSWNRIYIAFADGRTWLEDQRHAADFYQTNVVYTLNMIEHFLPLCNQIVYFSTTELWNNYSGPLAWSGPQSFSYHYSPYVESKSIATERVLRYPNAIVLFPFQFNSVVRTSGQPYLFSKIFNSIINRQQVVIGDTYFYRELLHPKFVARQAAASDCTQIIGAGRLVYVNDFIRDLYAAFNMKYEDYVIESSLVGSTVKRRIFYLDVQKPLYSYSELLEDTVNDLWRRKNRD